MFLQYVDNGVLQLKKGFISRLVEGKICCCLFYTSSSFLLLFFCVKTTAEPNLELRVFFAEFDGEREEQDLVFQIICRLKHVSFCIGAWLFVLLFFHTKSFNCVKWSSVDC